jgi:hypothetical protein
MLNGFGAVGFGAVIGQFLTTRVNTLGRPRPPGWNLAPRGELGLESVNLITSSPGDKVHPRGSK